MEVSKINSLVELFFKKLEEVDNSKPFLNSLKSEKTIYSWKDVSGNILKLSNKLRTLINEKKRGKLRYVVSNFRFPSLNKDNQRYKKNWVEAFFMMPLFICYQLKTIYLITHQLIKKK